MRIQYAYTEPGPDTFRESATTLSRVIVGQIKSVTPEEGLVTVECASTQQAFRLAIPMAGFSPQLMTSSWQRYMPQRFDFVRIAFEPDNTPMIIGYHPFDESPGGVAPRQGAYAGLARYGKDNPNNVGSIFRTLQEGEWDMRSSGGAYILGTRSGTLNLRAGGAASIRLSKSAKETVNQGLLFRSEQDGVKVRWGEVRREIPPGGAEVNLVEPTTGAPLAPNPGAVAGGANNTFREFSIDVGYVPAVAAPRLRYYDFAAGTPTTALGAPELVLPDVTAGPTQGTPVLPAPLRARARYFGASGIEPALLRTEVDHLGNVQVAQAPTATTGINVVGPRVFIGTNAGNATVAALGSVFLGSEGALLTRTPGVVGPQAFVLGTHWDAQRKLKNDLVEQAHTETAAFANGLLAAAVKLAADAASMSAAPLTPVGAALGTLAGSLNILATALTRPHTAAAAGILAFEEQSYLSSKIFGE